MMNKIVADELSLSLKQGAAQLDLWLQLMEYSSI